MADHNTNLNLNKDDEVGKEVVVEIESLDPFKPRTSLARSPTRRQSLDESTPALIQIGKENVPSASGSQIIFN